MISDHRKADQGLQPLSDQVPIDYYALGISPEKLARVLSLVVIGLVICHLSVHFIAYTTGHKQLYGFFRQFDLDSENNLPTWYSSLTLLFCAVLLGIIGLHERKTGSRSARYWQTLAAVFLYLASDEAASLHEMTSIFIAPIIKQYDWFHGYLYYPWVIFGALGVLIFVGSYRRFVVTLPIRTRYLFILAGTLYVGGALGVEIAGGRSAYSYGTESLTYTLLVACEECLEMLGVVVFIYALASYLRSLRAGLQILVSESGLR